MSCCLQSLLTRLIIERPADPLTYMIGLLEQESNGKNIILCVFRDFQSLKLKNYINSLSLAYLYQCAYISLNLSEIY